MEHGSDYGSDVVSVQKMPAVKARLGEQEFKDFVEPLQKALDEMCATLV